MRPVHIAVVVAVIMIIAWITASLLRGRCVIQIHHGCIDLLVPESEIRANTLAIKSVGCSTLRSLIAVARSCASRAQALQAWARRIVVNAGSGTSLTAR